MKIKLEKLNELPDARHPNNIEVGRVVEGEFNDEPQVGECFWVGAHWRTSVVQEVIDANTFRTYNSIYRWTVIEDGNPESK
jgi:hypothetical protein